MLTDLNLYYFVKIDIIFRFYFCSACNIFTMTWEIVLVVNSEVKNRCMRCLVIEDD